MMRLLASPLPLLITFVVLYLHYDQILFRPPGVHTAVPCPETLHYSEALM